ncbi:type II secretion system F family protein [Herbaspirillum chlorophenolicum]|uniref:Type II secretion system F family protein n=1 Tax=Herbaspirillum chlorophenolicum TaxID=211589 RepID=A0ABW8EY45_9BURK
MEQERLIVISMLLLAAAALLIAGAILLRDWQLRRSEKVLNRRIDIQQQQPDPEQPPAVPSRQRWLDHLANYAAQWVDTPLGRQLVAEEDRQLLDQCGVNDIRGKALFFATRVLLGAGIPIIAWIVRADEDVLHLLIIGFFGFGIGYMIPKWVMLAKAKERRRKAAEELPLLIDLLRLLQGVGLSIDQSLHVVQNEFAHALPVLSKELQIASQQYLNGRTREQSLKRFSTVFDNDDMNSIGRLIVQVDRYGGAVQQPLQQFSERIREQRKMEMKERIGKLTVKMTGVMVLTLLPGLLIITGGAGFIAIIRTLSQVGT